MGGGRGGVCAHPPYLERPHGDRAGTVPAAAGELGPPCVRAQHAVVGDLAAVLLLHEHEGARAGAAPAVVVGVAEAVPPGGRETELVADRHGAVLPIVHVVGPGLAREDDPVIGARVRDAKLYLLVVVTI